MEHGESSIEERSILGVIGGAKEGVLEEVAFPLGPRLFEMGGGGLRTGKCTVNDHEVREDPALPGFAALECRTRSRACGPRSQWAL